MSNAKAQREELKKLEDEAYFELCQIIAEAMQIQDINLLDQRINNWKKKYKKLLDSSSPASANFKKRIEYLLNQYYSEITQYILTQIKKQEEKKIENQSKALKKLYKIIKETNDLDLLKKKVKEWEKEYPKSSFLKMYQRRIESYTRTKNLEDNAFDQKKAFFDLYYMTKLNRTYDEFKEELNKWEDKYSIHNKFELDDFIKNQSDVKRYTSDEYLKSIARVEEKPQTSQAVSAFVEEKSLDSSKEDFNSNLAKQAAAYNALKAIANKPNNIDEIFKWVYKNNTIKFNDKYKERILNETHLDYSPTYLNSLSVPKIDFSGSLSYEEYKNMDEIKRYAVISYFNLLLPPEQSISNSYFKKYIEVIYRNSTQKPHLDTISSDASSLDNTNISKDETLQPKAINDDISSYELLKDGVEISLSQNSLDVNASIENHDEENLNISKVDNKNEEIEEQNKLELEEIQSKPTDKIITAEECAESDDEIEAEKKQPKSEDKTELIQEQPKHKIKSSEEQAEPEYKSKTEEVKSNIVSPDITKETKSEQVLPDITGEIEFKPVSPCVTKETESEPALPDMTEEAILKDESEKELSVKEFNEDSSVYENNKTNQEEDISYDTIIAFSPQFFNMINDYNTQANLITFIDNSVENYMSLEKPSRDINKTRTNAT